MTNRAQYTTGVRSFSHKKFLALREELGISQEYLSKISGISKATIYNLEKGGFPLPKIFLKISHTLNVPPTDLLTREPKSLEEYRWVKGLSATEAAKKIGITQTSLTKIESKSVKLNSSIAKDLADVLDISIEEVFKAYFSDSFA